MDQQARQQDDEINLYDIGQTLYHEKLTILSITALFSLFGGLFVFFYPVTYQGNIPIKPVSTEVISQYHAINAINTSDLPYGKKIKSVISSNRFFQLFLAELLSSKTLRSSIMQYSQAIKLVENDEAEAKRLVYQFLQDIEIIKPSEKRKNNNKYLFHEIKFSGKDKQELYTIIASALHLANKKVQKSIQIEIKNIRDSILHAIENKKKRIKKEIFLAKYLYNQKTASQIAFLEEQAAIARTLGIKKNTLSKLRNSKNSIGIQVNGENPFYLRGYQAIEKELSLLKSRDSINLEKYIASLPKFKTDLARLENEITIPEIDTAIALTPLNNANFMAVDYDLSLVFLIKKTKTKVILILFIFVGLLLSTIGVLMRKGYKSHRVERDIELRRLEDKTILKQDI